MAVQRIPIIAGLILAATFYLSFILYSGFVIWESLGSLRGDLVFVMIILLIVFLLVGIWFALKARRVLRDASRPIQTPLSQIIGLREEKDESPEEIEEELEEYMD